MSDGLLVDLLLEGGDLGADRFTSASSLASSAVLVSITSSASEDLLLDLGLAGVVVGDLVLEGLVLFVLLDQVELDLQVVDLGFDALERVFVFLELNLAVLECLAGLFQFGLAVGQGRLCGRPVSWGRKPGGRGGPWRADATGEGRGDFRRSRASVAVLSRSGWWDCSSKHVGIAR